ARLAGRPDARHLDCRVRGGVRAVRLFARIGDRNDHGLRPADHRRRGAGSAQRVLSRSGGGRQGMTRAQHELVDRSWRALLLGLMTLFVVNIGLMIAAVATSSFARRWLGTWLPEGWTTQWYTAAWKEFQLDSVLWVTVLVVLAVVFLALLIGVPAAY